MSQSVQGTFVTGANAYAIGAQPEIMSDTLVVPSDPKRILGTGGDKGASPNQWKIKLTIRNDSGTSADDGSVIDASNTVKTQKRLCNTDKTNNPTWTDQVTYNSAQTNTVITVAEYEEWRLVLVAQQANKCMNYEMQIFMHPVISTP